MPLILTISVAALAAIALAPARSDARWAKTEDAGYAVNFNRADYKIRKDGSYDVVVERQIEILKEKERLELGLFRLSFDARSSSLEVISAKTINSKRTISVSKRSFEIKPLASSGPGFDVVKQLTIAFPEVSIGSKLYVKYRRTVAKPLVPGLYYEIGPLAWNELVESWSAHYESEVPLYYEIQDPDRALEASAKPMRKGFTLDIKSKAKMFKSVLEENNAVADARSLIWIGVTTAKDWSHFPKAASAAYEHEFAASLPPAFEKILEKANALPTDVDRINAVNSALADAVRYVGDWRLVRGSYFPRSLKEIAESGYGDCKDYSVSAGAILRRLGFNVRAAWIARGKDWVSAPIKVAAPDINHAIVYAEKDGQVYWIDPTNSVSFAQAVNSDIADRPAIVLDPAGARLLRTPAMKWSDGSLELETEATFTNDKIQGKGTLTLRGRGAYSMTGAQLSFVKKTTDYMLIDWIASATTLESWELGEYDLRSRIVSDVAVPFEFTRVLRPTSTTAGPGHIVSASPFLALYNFAREGRVGNVRTEDPLLWKRTLRLAGQDAVFTNDVSCSGTSDWADFSRTIRKAGRDVVIVDEIKSKVSQIAATDLVREEFRSFQDKLVACMQDTVVVFK